MLIQSDREALKLLGFGERQAADILGRRRQALNAAIGKKSNRRGYFTVPELLVLSLAAKGRGREVNENALASYIESCVLRDTNRPDAAAEAAQNFLSGFGAFRAPDFSAADELWIVLPDFLKVRRGMADRAAELRQLPNTVPRARIVFMCSSPIQRDALKNFIEYPVNEDANDKAGRVLVLSESLISAQMTMVIANPFGEEPQVYALTRAGFLNVPYVDGGLLAEFLRQRVDRLVNLPVYIPPDHTEEVRV